jgi:phytoene synthase
MQESAPTTGLRRSPSPESADLAACRALLRDGSRTFLAASMLLPRAVRDPACVLYAFCRLADDAADTGAARNAGVARLRERLERVYAGRPLPIAADRALAHTVARHGIPQTLLDALFEGLDWDLQSRRYETLDDLLDYAARVAGTVGAMMALLMGVRTREGLARACDLGVAMQLSNIARDVGEDARNGRLYLPLAWLRGAGIEPEAWLARPQHGDALAGVVRRLLRVADGLYRRVDDGVARLPPACRPGINAARWLYAEIGREVERRGCNAVDGRAVVPPARKLAVLLGALLGAALARPRRAEGPLAATRFLVEAAAAVPRPAAATAPVAWWQWQHRVVGVIDLFDRLERRGGAA